MDFRKGALKTAAIEKKKDTEILLTKYLPIMPDNISNPILKTRYSTKNLIRALFPIILFIF